MTDTTCHPHRTTASEERGGFLAARGRTVAAVLLATALCLPRAEARAEQPDVAIIDRIHAAIMAEADSDKIERALLALLMEQVSTLPSDRGYPSGLGLDQPEFEEHLEDAVAKLMDGVGRDRNKQLELLRSLGTVGAAEAIVADYLGFDGPGRYLPERDEEPTKPSLASQVNVGPPSSMLALAPDRWKLGGERGGPGAGNGVLDAGEWVKLTMALDNTSNTPLFSSSAYLRTDSACAWVDGTEEHVLAEMNPETGKATVSAWVYLSSGCAHGTSIPLRLDVYDTHRAPSTPQTLRASLKLTNLDAPSISDSLLDTDTPGSSDGSEKVPIEPYQRFELASDLTVRGPRPEQVRMAYHPEPLSKALFDGTYRNVPLMFAGGTSTSGYRFQAGDDLDLVTAGTNGFERALGEHPIAAARAADGRSFALFAVDTQIWIPSPEPISNAAPAAAPTPKPLQAADLIRLVQPFIHLEPRPATKVSGDATEATDGYEVLFDKQGFGEAYEGLVWPATPEGPTTSPDPVPYTVRSYVAVPIRFESAEPSCQIALPMDRQGFSFDDEIKLVGQVLNSPSASGTGLEVRWISDLEGLVARTKIKTQGATNGVTALEAGTHTLTMSATHDGVEICEDEVVIAVRRPQRVAEPEPVEPIDEYEPTRFRLDLGLASASGAINDHEDPDIIFADTKATLIRVGARLTVGTKLRSTWLVHIAPPTSAPFASAYDDNTLFQTVLGGGVAYGLGSGEFVQLEPRLTAGLTLSTLVLADDPNDSTVVRPFVAPGATFIIKPTRGFGLHASLDMEVSTPWEPFDFGYRYEMISGVGLRPGGGVSLSW